MAWQGNSTQREVAAILTDFARLGGSAPPSVRTPIESFTDQRRRVVDGPSLIRPRRRGIVIGLEEIGSSDEEFG